MGFDGGPAAGIPQDASIEHSIAADDQHLLQHPWRGEVGSPDRKAPSTAKGRKAGVGAGRGSLVFQWPTCLDTRTEPGEPGGIASSRHRAHLHPDATAPPISR